MIRDKLQIFIAISSICLIGMLGFAFVELHTLPKGRVVSEAYIEITVPLVNEEIENRIINGLEKQISTIPGIVFVSTFISSGKAFVKIKFDPKLENNIKIELSRIINSIESKMGRSMNISLKNQQVNKNELTDIMSIAFYSDKTSLENVSKFCKDYLKKEFESIPEISNVILSGSEESGFEVKINPDKMYALNISLENIMNAIQSRKSDVLVGTVYEGSQNLNIVLKSDSDISKLLISNSENKLFYLSEIASITPRLDQNQVLLDHKPIFFIKFIKEDNTNMLDACKAIKKRLSLIQDIIFRNDIEYKVLNDQSELFNKGILEVIKAFIESVIIVSIITLFFLSSIRKTIAIIISIPLSLIPVCFFIWLFNCSLNIYTLFASILAIGLVIDDAIVVTEYVTESQNIFERTRKIAGTIFLISITLFAAYLPLIFLKNNILIKDFYEFAVVISTTVLFSGFVAIFIIPYFLSLLLNEKSNKDNFKDDTTYKHKNELRSPYNLYYLYKLFLEKIFHTYSIIFFLLILLPLALSYFLLNYLTITFDRQDIGKNNEIQIIESQSNLRKDFNIDYKVNYFKKLSNDVKQSLKGIKYDLISAEKRDSSICFYLNRKCNSNDINNIRDIISKIPTDLSIRDVSSNKILNPYSIHLQTYAMDIEDIFELSREVSLALREEISKIYQENQFHTNNINILFSAPGKKTSYTIDLKKEKCQKVGISPDLAKLLLTNLQEDTFIQSGGDSIFLSTHKSIDSLMRVPIKSLYDKVKTNGSMQISLSSIGDVRKLTSFDSIYHVNSCRGITFYINVEKFIGLKEINRIVKEINERLPHNVICTLDKSYIDQNAAFNQIKFLFIFCILSIFLLLALKFNSLIQPLIIISTFPFAILGSFVGLKIFDLGITIPASIGIITLVGLIVKHGILIIDAINSYTYNDGDTDKDIKEKVIRASVSRLRPIFMTTLCMLAGAIPLMDKNSAFSDYQYPIGISLFSGILLGTIFVLIIVPSVAYKSIIYMKSNAYAFCKKHNQTEKKSPALIKE